LKIYIDAVIFSVKSERQRLLHQCRSSRSSAKRDDRTCVAQHHERWRTRDTLLQEGRAKQRKTSTSTGDDGRDGKRKRGRGARDLRCATLGRTLGAGCTCRSTGILCLSRVAATLRLPTNDPNHYGRDLYAYEAHNHEHGPRPGSFGGSARDPLTTRMRGSRARS
jgi:hypothetical protein